LTVSAARSLHRYGVRANVICPRARTDMTAATFGAAPDDGPDPLSVQHVAPFVAFLAGPAAERINGQVFIVHGGTVALLAPPTVAQRFTDSGTGWSTEKFTASVGEYFTGHDLDDVFACTEALALP
jgi:3-oxoacyl-[acyl-carrier protein] reductase